MPILYKINLLKLMARYCKEKQGDASYANFVDSYKSLLKIHGITDKEQFMRVAREGGWKDIIARLLKENIYKSKGGFIRYVYKANRKRFNDAFIRLLKKNNSLEEYIENIDPAFIRATVFGEPYRKHVEKKVDLDEIFIILQPYSFVMYAFEWLKTPQGHEKWRIINQEWEKYLDNHFSKLLIKEL